MSQDSPQWWWGARIYTLLASPQQRCAVWDVNSPPFCSLIDVQKHSTLSRGAVEQDPRRTQHWQEERSDQVIAAGRRLQLLQSSWLYTTFTHFPDSHPYLDSHPSVFLSRSLSFFVCLFLVRFLTLILNYFYLLTNHKLWTDTSTQSSVGSITVLKIQKKYKVLVAQSCPTLCDPMNCSLPGSSLSMGILQARMLEWVDISFSRGSFWPRDGTQVSCIAGRFFTIWATREAQYSKEHNTYIWNDLISKLNYLLNETINISNN